ncbi:protein kinase family protein [Mariniflexile gromovii]|uniref:Protein kinase family protein n=1 Tax=Mariniflexile gromovii TaxID=362523 RepID=A0ABS4BU71_9FLAO|nr:protein kinase family protein [Mariniflexile gromovii]MBP0904143.1 protein kinase family protein [Mariniflexile gromovii]
MDKYCCFNCPQKDYSEKELSDKCPKCGMNYGFPLDLLPTEVNGFKLEKSIARGFYGATYIATSKERIPKKRVLKIIPKGIYELFGKNFENECNQHSQLENEHIVEIHDYFDEDVDFNGTIIPCHVCILDYVDGSPLKKEMESDISIEKLTQIVIDLLEILEVLKNNGKSHNDLHPGNILVSNLSHGTKRVDQIDNSIRLIVIDLNSTSDGTQSSEMRLGDINWIGNSILGLSEKFIERKEQNKEELTDKENRILSHFENYGKLLIQKVTNTRIPNFGDLIYDIKNTYRHVVDSWNETFTLQSFDYAYNAQTLKPNYVPALFVDPNNKFFNESVKPGPLIIYGMRGCGKTLLLLGLSFYSRISSLNADRYSKKGSLGIIERIKNDGFIGLYINSNRLLDPAGKKTEIIFKPLERIYLRFSLEALRTLRTLKKIDDHSVVDLYYEILTNEIVSKVSNIDIPEVKSDKELDDILIKKINLLEKNEGDEIYISTAAPAVFEDLSTAITNCSPLLLNHKIFYLLDDVSTRYLNQENIIQIISTFIFQSSKCAFKITTEAQTLNAILFSPGIQEKTRIGRDLQTFDLGNLVNEQIRNSNNFVVNILEKRNKLISKDSNSYPLPGNLLGDVSLKEIALNITKTGANKKNKKQFYHGISMLSKVCVGDIGDIIHIYNLMLEEYKKSPHTPLKVELQNRVYQNISANKLFDLDRNKNDLKDFALTFARASYKLLMESKGSDRLRQYNSIYVKISSGDQEFQIDKLRSLVDAGIFIYDGSPQAPRTTGNDTNPLLQFKLAFRKLLGLTNFIGISHSDRFELSGPELEAWLRNPQEGENILLKNKIIEDGDSDEASYGFNEVVRSTGSQVTLDFVSSKVQNKEIENFFISENQIIMSKNPFDDSLINDCEQYVLGIGFEDRTYESLNKVIINPRISKIYAIKHKLEEGRFNDIKQTLNKSNKEISIIDIGEIDKIDYSIKTIIDVSGLSKSMIFRLLIKAKKNINEVVVLETEAKSLSPSEEDLKEIVNTQEQATEILKTVSESIELGELKPYTIENIYSTDTDESNSRVVLCFSSSKFERMLTFLDQKQYDKILIINPNKDDYRSQLARLSSQVIQDKYSSLETEVIDIDTNNQNEILKVITMLYQKYYLQEGCNFDIALTGSKVQTVCASIFASMNKINNCWYISPKEWKSKAFSSGISDTFIYSINAIGK